MADFQPGYDQLKPMRINFQQPQDSEAFAACLQKAKAIVASYRAEAPTGCDPQNVTEIGPEWDPRQSEYLISEFGTDSAVVIGGLIALSAFAMMGTGGFYTVAAAEAAPAVPLTTVTFTAVTPVGMTPITAISGAVAINEGQALALAVLQTGQITLSEGAIAVVLDTWGFETLTLEGIVALAQYDTSSLWNAGNHGNFGSYLGGFIPGGPGLTTPPGFPGFPGYIVRDPGVPGALVCWTHNDVEYCHWEY